MPPGSGVSVVLDAIAVLDTQTSEYATSNCWCTLRAMGAFIKTLLVAVAVLCLAPLFAAGCSKDDNGGRPAGVDKGDIIGPPHHAKKAMG